MILVDANLLVYAATSEMPQHDRVRPWLDDRLNGVAPVGLPWPSLLTFIRLVSNPRVFEHPRPVADAWDQVTSWLGCAPVWVPQPAERHAEILGELLRRSVPRSNLVPDAHLAALALEHGLVLCSTDGDFGRFPDLRWENPLG
ncbi:MAG: TA system VapC family ribonuclease toxin [Candidatus Rokuibacteriota bacterium]